jgi:hypothetical protein
LFRVFDSAILTRSVNTNFKVQVRVVRSRRHDCIGLGVSVTIVWRCCVSRFPLSTFSCGLHSVKLFSWEGVLWHLHIVPWLCIFMPSVTAIASKARSLWQGLVVRVGSGGRTGGIPTWLCRVLRSFALATLWSRVRQLRAMLCGIERCWLNARIHFMCCWPCSGCVRRFRLRTRCICVGIAPGSGRVQINSRAPVWAATRIEHACQSTDSSSAVRGKLFSVKLHR